MGHCEACRYETKGRHICAWKYNGLGCRYVKREGWELNDGILGGTVYISSNGNVLDACDLSYEHIDEDPIGNILTEDFESIVNRFAERDQD